MSGIDGIKIIRSKYKHIKPIVLTVLDNADVIFEALRNGAQSYVLKTDQPSEILNVLSVVRDGGAYLSPSVAVKVAIYFSNERELIKKKLETLTERESQVISLLKVGYRYQDIADEIFISLDTVRYHIKNIYQKLEVNSKIDAINLIR
jgi:DNA-binding NarL/FixJ family response regulator